VSVIIAAVVGGILLLWGGIVGLLRVVSQFERKHVLLLGAYTTLVAASVMGLVLYTNYERQKQHRQELQEQMNEFSRRLNQLSEKLVSQLEEKADLTASEFEIRVQLQNEKANHERTRNELEARKEEYAKLKRSLDSELAAHRRERDEQNLRLNEQFQKEEVRYQGVQELLEIHRRSLQTAQKQLSSLQEDLSRLNSQTSALQKTHNSLLGTVNGNRQILDLSKQQIDALVRSQAVLDKELGVVKVRIDSLYTWQKKK